MTQKDDSSYLPIIYILCITLCLGIIHIAEKVSYHYHQKEIRNLSKSKKDIKFKRPVKVKITKAEEKKADTLSNEIIEEPVFEDSISASSTIISDDDFFANVISSFQKDQESSQSGPSRSDIVIRYYKKNKDTDAVYDLRNLGFYIHERSADNEFDDYASNSIFYGDSVNQQDIIVIAHRLITNGVKIQNICLSKFHDNWKAHSIEIGTDTASLNKPPITLSLLRKQWEDQ